MRSWITCGIVVGGLVGGLLGCGSGEKAADTQTNVVLSITVSGDGSIRTATPGIDCGTDCTETYALGTAVALTATPGSGSTFVRWSGCDSPSGTTCSITMSGDRQVTATFAAAQSCTLTVAKDGVGASASTVTGGGIDCGSDCTETYAAGTAVTLTASPGSGTAVTWSGCDSQSGNTCSLTMNASRTVTATFATTAQSYTLTVNRGGTGTGTVTGNGIDCGATCAAVYPAGTLVVLTAVGAGTTSTFDSWLDCPTPVGSRCNLTMTQDLAVTALFTADAQSHKLTVSVSGSGRVTGNGIDCAASGPDCTETFAGQVSTVLTATPDAGWGFTGWTNCPSSSGAQCTVPMTQDRNVTATFTAPDQSFTLTVEKSGFCSEAGIVAGGGINCGATCSSTFAAGTVVTLIATVPAGCGVFSWGGCDAPNGLSCNMTMNGNKQVTAGFNPVVVPCTPSAPLCKTLAVLKSGAGAAASTVSGGGIDCGTTCSGAFAGGATVTLTATPASGFAVSWSACDRPDGNNCMMFMGVSKTVTATFESVTQNFTLSVEKNGGGPESTVRSTDRGGPIDCGPTCSATLAAGTGVTLTAEGGSGYAFSGYQGCDSVARTNLCYLTMDAPKRVMATFTPLAQVCTPNATHCIAGNPGAQEVCNAQGTAWSTQSCGAWKLCTDARCRIVCEVTDAGPSNPLVCFVPNKDGVNAEILYYAHTPAGSPSLVPPTYSTAFTLSQVGSAPIYPVYPSGSSSWPYAWSLVSPSGVAAATFRLDQFPGLPPTVKFYFRARDAQAALTSSAYVLITAANQGVIFRTFRATSSLGSSWVDDSWTIGGTVNAGWNLSGGGNEFDLGSTTSGFAEWDVSAIDVNYIAVEVVPP